MKIRTRVRPIAKLVRQCNSGVSAGCAALILLTPAAYAGVTPINVTAPLTDWDVVVQSPRFDVGDDQRGLFRLNLDLVGNAGHPLLATLFDAGGSSEEDEEDDKDKDKDKEKDAEFGLRVRFGDAGLDRGFDGNLWLGLDADRDGDLDALLNLVSGGDAEAQVIVHDLDGAATSPANTNAVRPTLVAEVEGDAYAVVPVSASSDPRGSDNDLNNDGNVDGFVSFKVSWAELAAAINSKLLTGQGGELIGSLNGGEGLTPYTPVQWVVITTARDNRMAGDIAGYDDRQDSLSTTYAAQGAFLQVAGFGNLFPQIISDGGGDAAVLRVQERTTLVTRVQGNDANGDSLAYSIQGGDDAALFTINGTTGLLNFAAPPRVGTALDTDGDNIYQVIVAATDPNGAQDLQALDVRVLESDVQPDAAFSEILVSPGSLAADGRAKADITVLLRDSDSNAFTLGGDGVQLQATAGTISGVTDNGDGSYSAVFTAGTVAGVATVSGTVNGAPLPNTVAIQLLPGAPFPENTDITLANTEVLANGTASSEVVVQLQDINGNNVAAGENAVTLEAELGSVSELTENPNGSLTALYTAPAGLEQASAADTLRAQVNGRPAGEVNLTLTLDLLLDADGDGISNGDEGLTTDTDVDGSPNFLDADDDGDGIASLAEGVTDADEDGIPNYLDTDSDEDGIADTQEGAGDSDADGTPNYLDPDDDGDGIGTLVEGTEDTDGDGLPNHLDSDSDNDGLSDQGEGTADSDGDGVPDYLDEFAELDVSRSELSTDSGSLPANGEATADITLQLRDTAGNPFRMGGTEVAFEASAGSISAPRDLGDGLYTAVFTAGTAAQAATITASANGMPLPAGLQIELLATAADPAMTGISVAESELVADGESTTVVTVRLRDSNGNPVASGENNVSLQVNRGSVNSVSTNSDGTLSARYSAPASLDAATATAVVQVRVNEQAAGEASINLVLNPAGDADQDGLSNADEGTDTDSDENGVPNFLDPDDDGDGISTLDESTADFDENGVPNYLDNDSDGDGINDGDEGAVDADGDGLPDYLDEVNDNALNEVDRDRDGIPNVLEAAGDADGDGTPNAQDADSDGDGLPDALEAGLQGIDSDLDTLDDALDVDATGGADANGDGIDDAYRLLDTDGDGTPDVYDQDSDNDGLSDNVEGAVDNIDGDSDGIDRLFDVDATGGADANGDGVDDAAELIDSDGDGVADLRDLDSDNDGLLDVAEEGLPDADSDGQVDDSSLVDVLMDSDADGIPNARDTDSNGDGVPDIAATAWAALDADGNGVIDSAADDDGDGIANGADLLPQIWGNGGDADGDGVGDLADVDIDGDGIANIAEGDGDTDGDGVPDAYDRDSDNDGISDREEADRPVPLIQDQDADGLDDSVDVDATGGDDSNGDNVDNRFKLTDTDNDGTPDYLDSDSDNDKLTDSAEHWQQSPLRADSDGDGIDDRFDVNSTGGEDLDGDGIDDSAPGAVASGGSEVPAYRDPTGDTSQKPGDGEGPVEQQPEPPTPEPPAPQPEKPVTEASPPKVKTAVRGAGGVDGAWLLGALLLMLVVRFGRHALGRRTIGGITLLALPMAANAHFHDCEPDERFNFEEVHCWYGGISVGQSMLEPEIEGDVWSLSENGDTAMGLLAGYQILPHWFGEIAFHDLGEAVFESDSFATTPAISYRVPSLMVGYNLANPSSHWNVFVKAGIARIMNAADETEIDFEAGSSAQFAIGGGVQFSFNPHWHLRLEVNSYDKDATTYGLTFIRRGGFMKLSDVLY